MTTLRDFRDGLIVVAAYFAVCALTSDAHAGTRKDSAMETNTDVIWHPHATEPATRVKAIIIIGTEQPVVVLSELYEWDTDQGYWVSASSRLRLRHPEFRWRDVAPLLASAPVPAWRRDEEATADLLRQVGIAAPAKTVAQWTDAQRRDAEDWASALYLWASDTTIVVPPMPDFLKPCEVQS